MADLSVEIAGVRFKNSVWLASGEPTESFNKMKRGIDMGAGAVVAKSYTNSQEYKGITDIVKFCILGSDRRPVYGKDIPKLYTNYCRSGIGRKEVSEDEWFKELVRTQEYAAKFDTKVIGSVFGSTEAEEMARLARRMERIGIPMVELDLACPQGEETQDKGGLVKTSQTYVDITKTVVDSVSIPVFAKLSPQQADLAVTAKGVKEAGAAGVTCHNRFLGFAVDIDNAKPYIWGWAGVGGPWMLPISLRWISKIYADDHNFPILGSSGVYDWQDVVQFHMAGASAVEVCSTIMVKGYIAIKRMTQGLNSFLDDKGYGSVRDIIGVATKAAHTYEEMHTLPEYQEKSVIDPDLCVRCGKCSEVCWYDAIVTTDDGVASSDEAKCKGCYNCRIICPVPGCITMKTAG